MLKQQNCVRKKTAAHNTYRNESQNAISFSNRYSPEKIIYREKKTCHFNRGKKKLNIKTNHPPPLNSHSK